MNVNQLAILALLIASAYFDQQTPTEETTTFEKKEKCQNNKYNTRTFTTNLLPLHRP